MGGKTRNIAIQLVFQQCCKTSCIFLLPVLPRLYSVDSDPDADSYYPAAFYAWQAVFLVTAIVVNNLHSCFALP